MAGDWIKLEHATVNKPEIDRIANRLDLDIDAVVGKCLRFWIWADQQIEDGDAPSVTKAFVDRIVYHDGFAEAMVQVGWLVETYGQLSIPNFSRHNGNPAKTRAQAKNRNAAKRKRDATGVTKASPEKRREEKSINTPSPREAASQKSGPKADPAWADEWATWVESWEGRTDRRFDQIQAELQLCELHSREPQKAKRDLRFSLEKYSRNILDSDDDWSKRSHGGSKPAKGSGLKI